MCPYFAHLRPPQRYFGGTVGTTSEVLKTRQVLGTCATATTARQGPPTCRLHSTHSRALPTRGAPKVTHTTSAPRRGLAASAWPTSLAEPKRLGRPCRLRATSSELIVASAPPRECPVKMICRTRGYKIYIYIYISARCHLYHNHNRLYHLCDLHAELYMPHTAYHPPKSTLSLSLALASHPVPSPRTPRASTAWSAARMES